VQYAQSIRNLECSRHCGLVETPVHMFVGNVCHHSGCFALVSLPQVWRTSYRQSDRVILDWI
jgi:hypothetical protein